MTEMTPIPAVASERERLIAEIDRAIADSFRVTRAFGRDVITEYFDGEFGCHAEAAYDYMAPQIESLSSQLNEARESLQRAQADALDARRLREALTRYHSLYTHWLDLADGSGIFLTADSIPKLEEANRAAHKALGLPDLWDGGDEEEAAALRTSSHGHVVPRGEDGEKGKVNRHIGQHERAAMERRQRDLRLTPNKSAWEGRELDELNRILGPLKEFTSTDEFWKDLKGKQP